MSIKLYNDDCLKVLPTLERESIDLIVTDPPYLINYRSNFRKKSPKFKKILNDDANDKMKLLFDNSMKLMSSLLNEGGAAYIFCSFHHIDFFKQTLQKYLKIKNILVWYKGGGWMGDLEGAYGVCNEFIIFAVKGRHILNGRRDNSLISVNKVPPNQLIHSNQKPVKLLQYLIYKSSKKGDTVLDCFMGSGSTGVAAKSLKRNFIGIEQDPEYYKTAFNRIYGIK